MTMTTDRRLRAEWEPHTVVLMAFPHEESDWAHYPDWEATTAPFVRIAQAIAYYQMVYLLCRDAAAIKPLFCSTTNIIFIETDYNDTWTRDYGALSLEQNGRKALLNFTFDGWGGKFEATKDNAVNATLASKGFYGGAPLEMIDYILEGGSIETDGEGTILTTTACLCNPNRNGGLDKSEVERKMTEYLGARRVLWLDHGYLAGMTRTAMLTLSPVLSTATPSRMSPVTTRKMNTIPNSKRWKSSSKVSLPQTGNPIPSSLSPCPKQNTVKTANASRPRMPIFSSATVP
jgi:agmatine/peptidylarginine deiminase